jgi:Mal s 1 allergenic protein-like
MIKNRPLFLWFVLQSSIFVSIHAQAVRAVDTTFKKYLPSENGLDHRSFLYVGEWDTRHPEAQKIFLVRNGKEVWDYSIPLHPAPDANQEFDDITMLPNRNIVFARMSGAGIVTPDKQLIWEYVCAPGTETHSCSPIGKDSVLMVLNANPAKVLIINTKTNKILKEIIIPTSATHTHGQFRHVRLTPNRTIMVGLMKEGKVNEYDLNGDVIWSVDAKSPWSAIKLLNGNVLISGDGNGYTREVDPSGKTVWEITQTDVPFKLYNSQTANRLKNGNTIICNWIGGNQKQVDWPGSVQVFEVTKEKKIVWILSAWDHPDLGTSTAIQMLTDEGLPDPDDVQR